MHNMSPFFLYVNNFFIFIHVYIFFRSQIWTKVTNLHPIYKLQKRCTDHTVYTDKRTDSWIIICRPRNPRSQAGCGPQFQCMVPRVGIVHFLYRSHSCSIWIVAQGVEKKVQTLCMWYQTRHHRLTHKEHPAMYFPKKKWEKYDFFLF